MTAAVVGFTLFFSSYRRWRHRLPVGLSGWWFGRAETNRVEPVARLAQP
jgi:hypothetical protein